MKNKILRIATIVMAVIVMFAAVNPATAEAATKKASLNKKKVTLTMTDKKASPSATLKVKNAGKVVKWTTTNKKVASIKKLDNNRVKIVAKKAGKAEVICKVGSKKLSCKVTVVDKRAKKNTDTGNTETTGNTGNSETTESTETTGNTETTECTETTGNSETAEKKPIGYYRCFTVLKSTGKRCTYRVDAYCFNDPVASDAITKHLAEHALNGEQTQFSTHKY